MSSGRNGNCRVSRVVSEVMGKTRRVPLPIDRLVGGTGSGVRSGARDQFVPIGGRRGKQQRVTDDDDDDVILLKYSYLLLLPFFFVPSCHR